MASPEDDSAGASSGLRHLLSTGFERSNWWMNSIAGLFAFASDVVKPILPYFTGLLVGITSVLFLLVWFQLRFRRLRNETMAAAASFFLITAVLAIIVWGIQRIAGNPEEGVAARTFSEIRQRTERIEVNTQQIIALLQKKPSPRPTTIAQHIRGNWGESDCAVVSYRFSRVKNALTIESLKRPSGTAPYSFVGTIIGEGDTAIEVRGEKPEATKGLSATFQYEGNGVTEHLRWQDHVSGGTDVELNRCD